MIIIQIYCSNLLYLHIKGMLKSSFANCYKSYLYLEIAK